MNRALRRRSSATGGSSGVSGGAGPGCSRSAGSWKKQRRPRDLRQFRDEYADLPPTVDSQLHQRGTSLDDTINTTLEQLRLIQVYFFASFLVLIITIIIIITHSHGSARVF